MSRATQVAEGRKEGSGNGDKDRIDSGNAIVDRQEQSTRGRQTRQLRKRNRQNNDKVDQLN